MRTSVRWTVFFRRAGTTTLALTVLFSLGVTLPQAAGAQVAGGSMAGGGAPPVNNVLMDSPTGPIDLPRCIHRATDDSQSTDVDDKRLTVWLSVRQQSFAKVTVSGFAAGQGSGTLKITLMSDGIPVAYSGEVHGTDTITAHAGVTVPLYPGRQYKIAMRPTAKDKFLGQFVMDVGVGKTCP